MRSALTARRLRRALLTTARRLPRANAHPCLAMHGAPARCELAARRLTSRGSKLADDTDLADNAALTGAVVSGKEVVPPVPSTTGMDDSALGKLTSTPTTTGRGAAIAVSTGRAVLLEGSAAAEAGTSSAVGGNAAATDNASTGASAATAAAAAAGTASSVMKE